MLSWLGTPNQYLSISVVVNTFLTSEGLGLPDSLLLPRQRLMSLEVLEPQLGGSEPWMALCFKTTA